ncbi:MAG: T9SS type A sorting domain-containing protein [Bacteroidetes bacterium]|nr:T9SS type A sorting domain-containing protein [Bacteroidota bacterium]
MKKRTLLPAIVLLALLFPSQIFSQGAGGGGGESVLGLPIITCRVEVSATQLFFQDNDYNPNQITVTVWVRNVGPEDTAIARDVEVTLLKDGRFILPAGVPSTKPLAATLLFDDSASVSWVLLLADTAPTDQNVTVGALTTSTNAYAATAEKSVWVEREHFPVFLTTVTKQGAPIIFDDNTDDYIPNPFTVKVDVQNLGLPQGASDSTWIRFIGTRGVSPFPSDSPDKYLDRLSPGETKSALFQLVPLRRNNDTTVCIRFQVRGIGGYHRKTYIQEDSVCVFIPAAKQAEYEVVCDIVPDFVEYKDHKYNPDPFDYNVTITNIGTAVGKNVCAKLILPPGIQKAAGEPDEKCVGDLNPNASASLTWKLRPVALFERDTLKVCVRVFDIFNNQAVCCDSVIIDSVRKAIFDVACVCPDTIFADTQAGIYINSPFDVFFTACNVGSDYADNVKATIIIQAPNVSPVTGFPAKQDGPAKLDTLDCHTFTWPLQAEATAVGRMVRIIFRVEADNAEPVECVCEVFVQKLDAPNLEVWCEMQPAPPIDSLHFDPRTGGYAPSSIIYRFCATNEGGGIAKNVKATLAIPPRMILANGETLEKPFPIDLGPNDTSCIEWVLIPVKRTDFGSYLRFTAEATAENLVERPTAECYVYVPALPNTVAMSIPRNNVGYTGQLILVPIFIDDPSGKDVHKFDIELDYNIDQMRNRFAEDIIEFIEVVKVNSLTATWDITSQGANPSNDKVNFTLVSPVGEALRYPDIGVVPPLVWLKFRAVYGQDPNSLDITSTDLLWPPINEIEAKIRINDGSIFPRVTDGLVWVSGDCLRPLTASPDYLIFNRPNPFNPATTIQYTIPRDERVKITVFDALGREVEILVDELRSAGTHSVVFDAKQLPSGIYFYRMETPHYNQMKKMVVAK